MKPKSSLLHFLALAGSSLLAVSSASAQSLFWDADGAATAATGGSGAWLDSNTWRSTSSTGTLGDWIASRPAVFAGGDGTYAVTVGGAISTSGITFSNSGYTLSAALAQTITSGNISIASGKSATIGTNVTLSRSGANLELTGGGTLIVGTGGKIQGTAAGVFGTSGTAGNLNVDGGTAEFATLLVPGNADSTSISSITLASGGSITVAGTTTSNGLRFGSTTADGGGGTFHLNGGTLTVTRIYEGKASNTSTFNFNGGTLKVQTGSQSLGGFMTVDTANVRDGGAIIDTNSQNVTIAQALLNNGTGGLTKIGAGTLTLSGANTYIGATTLNQGTLTVGTGGTLGASTAALSVNNTNTAAGTDAILNLATAVDTTTGSLSGTIATPTSGTNTATINTQTGRNFTVNQTANGTFAGVIAGAGSFTLGSGSTHTLTLSGANTYTGATTINGGTLLVNGTHTSTVANTNYTVNANSTLGGNGRLVVDGNVSVASTGILAPGASIGTLTLDGLNTTGAVLTMTTGSRFGFELDGSGGTPDQLAFWNYLSGDLGLNDNSIDLTLLGTQTPGTYSVDIFRFFSDSGTLAATHAFSSGLTIGTLGTGIDSAFIDWDGTGDNNQTIALTYTVIPEPGAALLGSLGLLLLLRRRR